MNVVMTGDGRLVEVQATAERDAVHARGARRAARPRGRRDRARSRPRSSAAVQASVPDVSLGERAPAAGARRGARRRGRARARAARARRRGCGRTCSCRVGSALFTLVSAYGFSELRLRSRAGSRRPDAHRRADRHGHRLPRRRRDHPPGADGARAHDRRDALGRRRDRHGARRRLLQRAASSRRAGRPHRSARCGRGAAGRRGSGRGRAGCSSSSRPGGSRAVCVLEELERAGAASRTRSRSPRSDERAVVASTVQLPELAWRRELVDQLSPRSTSVAGASGRE